MSLISLVEEKLPKYILKTDVLTNFGGYGHEDFYIQSPALPADVSLDLSPELTRETLKYFCKYKEFVCLSLNLFHCIWFRILENLDLSFQTYCVLMQHNVVAVVVVVVHCPHSANRRTTPEPQDCKATQIDTIITLRHVGCRKAPTSTHCHKLS